MLKMGCFRLKIIKQYFPVVTGVAFGFAAIIAAYFLFVVCVEMVGSAGFAWFVDKVKETKLFDFAVLVALATFVLKERLDSRRKHREQARKISAVKALLVGEIELNHFCLKRLQGIFRDASDEGGDDIPRPKFIYEVSQGLEYFGCVDSQTGDTGMTPIPHPTFKYYDRFIDVIAEFDGELFLLVQAAYERIREMEHVRNSLAHHLQPDEAAEKFRPADIRDSGFVGYAVDELNEVYPPMNALYQYCAGSELKNARVR